MSMDLDEAMALAIDTGRADRLAAQQAWVRERIKRRRKALPYDCGLGAKGQISGEWYRCPDCGKWELGRYPLMLNHGWDWEGGEMSIPYLNCCHTQLHHRHKTYPVFAASQEAQGCGPLTEPWTVAKRMYVHEAFLHTAKIVAWKREQAHTFEVREVPPCFRR